jgi:hypothetical protein
MYLLTKSDEVLNYSELIACGDLNVCYFLESTQNFNFATKRSLISKSLQILQPESRIPQTWQRIIFLLTRAAKIPITRLQSSNKFHCSVKKRTAIFTDLNVD